ncbi:MAG: helix-turn-helix transcriptional regulator [Chitinophagaceae bacterium]|nr:helix-turn-helix transcriptional regulator [Chitinophagaceae bacterium]MCW5925584.1 helix-turn-helix transcriptional regulator [Chitinophagaceae bacterium]
MATTTLKILREINGYKQDEVGNVLGINQNTYSRLERNPKRLTGEQAQKLAEFYNVSVVDILSESAPNITFGQNAISNNQNANGYVHSNEIHNHNGEVKALKEEIEYLRKQNSELIKALGRK